MKKKLTVGIVIFVAVLLLSSCMSLFTALTVEEPMNADSSMLVVELGNDGSYLVNNNYTGWAPIIKDSSGAIVPMQMINAISDAKTIYVAPNIAPGEYVMTAIRHVYTDYGLVTSSDYANYEPYVKTSYQVQQDFPLDKSVKVTVTPKKMVTLGYYDIAYEHNGGGFAAKDDRWKVLPSTVNITSEPNNKNILRVIKGSLNSTTWKLWNERNPELPL
ncbi:MAG: hypothetical protein EOM67_04740 [Spirochaetia bacterium]|nr:hypothetical protein [Spirochaetia bacterium]